MVSGVGIPSIDHPGFLLWEIIVSNVFDRVMAVFAGHRNPSALDLLLDSSDKTGPILTIQPRNIDPDENSVGGRTWFISIRSLFDRSKRQSGAQPSVRPTTGGTKEGSVGWSRVVGEPCEWRPSIDWVLGARGTFRRSGAPVRRGLWVGPLVLFSLAILLGRRSSSRATRQSVCTGGLLCEFPVRWSRSGLRRIPSFRNHRLRV